MSTKSIDIAQVSFNNKESLWEKIYLNFGIYVFNNKKLLFQALPGPFASTAWIEGDAEYNQILGQKFEAVTSDDNGSYNLDRNKIRRLKDYQEFIDLLYPKNTCESFRNQTIAWLNN